MNAPHPLVDMQGIISQLRESVSLAENKAGKTLSILQQPAERVIKGGIWLKYLIETHMRQPFSQEIFIQRPVAVNYLQFCENEADNDHGRHIVIGMINKAGHKVANLEHKGGWYRSKKKKRVGITTKLFTHKSPLRGKFKPNTCHKLRRIDTATMWQDGRW